MKRIIDTEFWNDDKIVELFSPEDKLFFLYLMTNPHTTQLGIYHINKKQAAFEIGYSADALAVLLDRFENKYGLIKYDQDTSEIAIKNYLRHSIIKGGKPIEDLLIKEIGKVKSKTLLQYIYRNLVNADNLNPTVESVLPLLNVNVNDNDNVNVVSYNDTYNDTYHDTPKEIKRKVFTPPTLQEVSDYISSMNYNVNAEAFVSFYESKGWVVGKSKMKDWKAAVRGWHQREVQKKGGWAF